MKNKLKDYIVILIGAFILAFGLYNIHAQANIVEGGELGLELLLKHFFNISPSITAFVFDFIFMIIGTLMLAKKFIFNTIYATICFSVIYYILELFPPVIPSLASSPLLASIIGALFVGIGCGLIVRHGAASGGDDSLALILAKFTKLSIGICYMLFDSLIIIVSMTYISFTNTIYSFLTSIISSIIIDILTKKTVKKLIRKKK